jgi:YbbR domain-containing protein
MTTQYAKGLNNIIIDIIYDNNNYNLTKYYHILNLDVSITI